MFLRFKRSATPVMMKFTTSVASMIMVIVKTWDSHGILLNMKLLPKHWNHGRWRSLIHPFFVVAKNKMPCCGHAG